MSSIELFEEESEIGAIAEIEAVQEPKLAEMATEEEEEVLSTVSNVSSRRK